VLTDRGRNRLVAVDVTGSPGSADFNRFRDRSGDRFTAEDGVYARENVSGQRVTKERVAQRVEVATQPSFRQMITVIGDPAKAGSVGVHASAGFRPAGTPHVARLKFVQWLDVI
jgi:L-amino acid N-acyltransferase YncA